ncbi:MAG: helix-turn-helix transcriptional regulator [Desulfurivibrio sp.]|nr:helix-turn-helix transcriptional regulator [Desulfurivibrio sp.]
MLEPTRKRHTDDTVELCFRGPAARQYETSRLLKDLGFEAADDTISWREAFPEYADDQLPGVRLRAARREGLTKEVARLADIPQAHISLMERGKMAIGVTRAKRLAKALNIGYKLFL